MALMQGTLSCAHVSCASTYPRWGPHQTPNPALVRIWGATRCSALGSAVRTEARSILFQRWLQQCSADAKQAIWARKRSIQLSFIKALPHGSQKTLERAVGFLVVLSRSTADRAHGVGTVIRLLPAQALKLALPFSQTVPEVNLAYHWLPWRCHWLVLRKVRWIRPFLLNKYQIWFTTQLLLFYLCRTSLIIEGFASLKLD